MPGLIISLSVLTSDIFSLPGRRVRCLIWHLKTVFRQFEQKFQKLQIKLNLKSVWKVSGCDINSNQNRMNFWFTSRFSKNRFDLVLNSLNTAQMCLSGVDGQTYTIFGIQSKVLSLSKTISQSVSVAGRSLPVTGQNQETGVVFNISSHASGGTTFNYKSTWYDLTLTLPDQRSTWANWVWPMSRLSSNCLSVTLNTHKAGGRLGNAMSTYSAMLALK